MSASARRARSYQKLLEQHLARYKRERLGVRDSGTWVKNCRAYPHILPKGLRRLNILETIRREFFEFLQTPTGRKIKLHQGFHHLTSSQAMGFNLLFPFFGLAESDPTVLLNAIGVRPDSIERWRFEAIPDRNEGSNFDLHIMLKGGRQIFLELKLSEREFGSAKADKRHQQKIERVYRMRLMGRLTDTAMSTEAFCKNYQLLRNVCCLDLKRGDQTIFVSPLGNEALGVGRRFLEGALTPEAKVAVRFVPLEGLTETLGTSTGRLPGRISTHMAMFMEKYIPARPL
jgi:hypothetical protein